MISGTKQRIVACVLFISIIFFNAFAWAEDLRRTFFKVNNLSCGACIGKIDTKLKTFEGYIRMLANLDEGLVAVDHRQNLSDSEISGAITSLGYPARKASVSEHDQQRSPLSESAGWKSPSDGFFTRLLRVFSR